MALHHNASNVHLSLTRCTSPLLCWNFDWASSWVYWPCDNSCHTCALCQRCVETTGTHVGMLTTVKPQRTAVKRCKSVRREAALVVLFVPLALCCKHPPGGSPVEMALLQMRGGGGGRQASRQCCHWATLVLAALCILVRVTPISGAFTQSFVPSLPHGFTSLLVCGNIRQLHASTHRF